MNKKKFIEYLRKKLRGYPEEEVNRIVDYYAELIDDKIERERLTEQAAIASLGDKDKVVKDCIASMSEGDVNYSRRSDSTMRGCVIGVFASPVLLPLAFALFVILFVVGVVWVSLVFSFGAAALGGIVGAVAGWFVVGYSVGETLLATGLGLITFVICFALCAVTAYFGAKLVKATAQWCYDSISRRK